MYISERLNKLIKGTCEFSYIIVSIMYSTKNFDSSVFNYNKVVLTIERSSRYCDEILALLKGRYQYFQVKIIENNKYV